MNDDIIIIISAMSKTKIKLISCETAILKIKMYYNYYNYKFIGRK